MNFIAVAVSTVASFLIGWVGFMIVFREPYIRGLDKTAEELNAGYPLVTLLLMGAILGGWKA